MSDLGQLLVRICHRVEYLCVTSRSLVANLCLLRVHGSLRKDGVSLHLFSEVKDSLGPFIEQGFGSTLGIDLRSVNKDENAHIDERPDSVVVQGVFPRVVVDPCGD